MAAYDGSAPFLRCRELEAENAALRAENVALQTKYNTMYRYALSLEEGLGAIRRRCQVDPSNLPAVLLAGEISAMVTALLSPQAAEPVVTVDGAMSGYRVKKGG